MIITVSRWVGQSGDRLYFSIKQTASGGWDTSTIGIRVSAVDQTGDPVEKNLSLNITERKTIFVGEPIYETIGYVNIEDMKIPNLGDNFNINYQGITVWVQGESEDVQLEDPFTDLEQLVVESNIGIYRSWKSWARNWGQNANIVDKFMMIGEGMYDDSNAVRFIATTPGYSNVFPSQLLYPGVFDPLIMLQKEIDQVIAESGNQTFHEMANRIIMLAEPTVTDDFTKVAGEVDDQHLYMLLFGAKGSALVSFSTAPIEVYATGPNHRKIDSGYFKITKDYTYNQSGQLNYQSSVLDSRDYEDAPWASEIDTIVNEYVVDISSVEINDYNLDTLNMSQKHNLLNGVGITIGSTY